MKKRITTPTLVGQCINQNRELAVITIDMIEKFLLANKRLAAVDVLEIILNNEKS